MDITEAQAPKSRAFIGSLNIRYHYTLFEIDLLAIPGHFNPYEK
jgi:hypothetical protein